MIMISLDLCWPLSSNRREEWSEKDRQRSIRPNSLRLSLLSFLMSIITKTWDSYICSALSSTYHLQYEPANISWKDISESWCSCPLDMIILLLLCWTNYHHEKSLINQEDKPYSSPYVPLVLLLLLAFFCGDKIPLFKINLSLVRLAPVAAPCCSWLIPLRALHRHRLQACAPKFFPLIPLFAHSAPRFWLMLFLCAASLVFHPFLLNVMPGFLESGAPETQKIFSTISFFHRPLRHRNRCRCVDRNQRGPLCLHKNKFVKDRKSNWHVIKKLCDLWASTPHLRMISFISAGLKIVTQPFQPDIFRQLLENDSDFFHARWINVVFVLVFAERSSCFRASVGTPTLQSVWTV